MACGLAIPVPPDGKEDAPVSWSRVTRGAIAEAQWQA
jgi:hypothetical protein